MKKNTLSKSAKTKLLYKLGGKLATYDTGGTIGDVLTTAAPFLNAIPGVGTVASLVAGFTGSQLKQQSAQDAAMKKQASQVAAAPPIVPTVTMGKGGKLSNLINAEHNELIVDPSNNQTIKDLKNLPPHPENEALIDPRGNIDLSKLPKAKDGGNLLMIPKNGKDGRDAWKKAVDSNDTLAINRIKRNLAQVTQKRELEEAANNIDVQKHGGFIHIRPIEGRRRHPQDMPHWKKGGILKYDQGGYAEDPTGTPLYGDKAKGIKGYYGANDMFGRPLYQDPKGKTPEEWEQFQFNQGAKMNPNYDNSGAYKPYNLPQPGNPMQAVPTGHTPFTDFGNEEIGNDETAPTQTPNAIPAKAESGWNNVAGDPIQSRLPAPDGTPNMYAPYDTSNNGGANYYPISDGMRRLAGMDTSAPKDFKGTPYDYPNKDPKTPKTGLPNPWVNNALSNVGNLYQLGNAIFNKETTKREVNPYQKESFDLMHNRRYDVNPQLRTNETSYRASENALRGAENAGGSYKGNLRNLYTQKFMNDAQAFSTKNNADNQYLGEEAQMKNQAGEMERAESVRVSTANEQNRARRQDMIGSSLGSIGRNTAETINDQYRLKNYPNIMKYYNSGGGQQQNPYMMDPRYYNPWANPNTTQSKSSQ